MALLCLLFIFQGVFADDPTPTPVPRDNLVYKGADQLLLDVDDNLYQDEYWMCRIGNSDWGFCVQLERKDAGEYEVEYYWGRISDVPPTETEKLTAVIAPAPVTLDWADLASSRTLVYNGQDQIPANAVSISDSDLKGEDVCAPDYRYNGEEAHKDAEYYTDKLIVTGLTCTTGKPENYALPEKTTADFEIKAKAVTLEWDTNTKLPYNGREQSLGVTVSGLAADDKCTAVTSGTGKTVSKEEYTTTVSSLTCTVGDPKNYSLPENRSANFTITPKEVTVTWDKTEFTYDGDSHCPAAAVSNLADGDSCEVTVEGKQTDAGTHTATAAKLSNSNYTLPDPKPTQQFTINPLTGIAVTIAGEKESVTYDGETHDLTSCKAPVITLNGQPTTLYKDTDFEQVNTCGKDATGKINAGTYAMGLAKECFKNNNKNFTGVNFNVTDGELTITKKSGIVVAIEGEKETVTYDGDVHNLSGYKDPVITLDGQTTDLYTADDFKRDENCGKDATEKINAGTYAMGLTDKCFENKNNNFEGVTFKVNDGELKITPKAVTITAGSTKKFVYDGTALTNSEFTVEPEVDHEFTVTMTKDSTVTDASKDGVPNVIATVDGVAVTTGEPKVIGNFTVTTVDGTLQVSGRPVTITAANAGHVYNRSPLTSDQATWSGLAETDKHEFDVTMTEDSMITNIGTQPNVIATVDGKNVSESGETIVGNYLVTIVNGTLTVTPKEVTITADDGTWEFDGLTHKQPEFSATKLEKGDGHKFTVVMTPESNVTQASTTPNVIGTVDNIAVTTGKPTKVGNYIVTTVDGTLTVTRNGGIVVTLEGEKATVPYDGKEHKLNDIKDNIVITLDGKPTELYTTGDFERDLTCGAAVGTDAGTYKMGLSKACFKNTNPNFTTVHFNVTDGKLVITPKEVTLTWNSDKSFVYTGKPQGPAAKDITIDGLAEGDKQADVAAITVMRSPRIHTGNYTARAMVTFDPANYVLSNDAKTEFPYSISKAVITVDPVPVLKSGPLPYTGSNQPLLERTGGLTCNNNADPCPGDIIYVVNGQRKTSPNENPSAEAIGEYTVSYYVTNFDTANYQCEADEAHPVEIGKIAIRPVKATFTVQNGQSIPYTGENLRPDITVTYEDGTAETYPYGNDPQKLKITITPSNSYPNAGTYTIKVESNDPDMAAEPVTAQFEIIKANYADNSGSGDVKAANSFAVIPIEGLTYNGNYQNLARVEWNEHTSGTVMFAVVDEDGEPAAKTVPGKDDFLPSAVARNAGRYAIYYYVIGDENHNNFPTDADHAGPVYAAIAKADLADAVITLDPSILPFTGEEITVDPQVTFNGILLTPGADYEISGNSGIDAKSYTLTISAAEGSNFFGKNSLQWRIKDLTPNHIEMFRIGQPEEVCLRCGIPGSELPATGLPTRVDVPLAVRPEGLNYTDLNMRIQIPTIDVDVELEGVPTMDGVWKVEWLDARAGLLSGTALPGEGYSIVAAHNTLNAEEYGPFALLSTLMDNDRIFVNNPDGSLRLFRVYANELMAPNDMEKLASVAEQEMNTLVLVTCENESVDGGYLNRRVVFAKPLN